MGSSPPLLKRWTPTALQVNAARLTSVNGKNKGHNPAVHTDAAPESPQRRWLLRYGVGVGYRVYFSRRAEVVYLLLVGGDKSSQKRDIKRAIEMARALNKE